MTRCYEEEWTADGERVELCENQPPYGSVIVKMVAMFTCHAPDDCTELDRAKLAAQAPAMARLLLKLGYEGSEQRCAVCGRTENDPCNTLDTGHHVGCELADILSAIGALD